MPGIFQKIKSAGLDRFGYHLTVEDVSEPAPGFRLLTLAGPEVAEQEWNPGDRVSIRTPDDELRTYTPFSWDAEGASMKLRLCAFVLLLAAASPSAGQRPPNVILILTDDLGWGDLACYGHDRIKTPSIDQLAREGTRLTQFYVASPICSPSRASFVAEDR